MHTNEKREALQLGGVAQSHTLALEASVSDFADWGSHKQEYEKVDVLGRGTFATVYLATKAGSPVALKNYVLDPSEQRRAIMELSVLKAKLPHVVACHAAYMEELEKDGATFTKFVFVLEACPLTLRQLMLCQKLSLEWRWHILCKLTVALESLRAHSPWRPEAEERFVNTYGCKLEHVAKAV